MGWVKGSVFRTSRINSVILCPLPVYTSQVLFCQFWAYGILASLSSGWVEFLDSPRLGVWLVWNVWFGRSLDSLSCKGHFRVGRGNRKALRSGRGFL